jgi:putative effector of murein hydrolase LrgA (UPF0299 family)
MQLHELEGGRSGNNGEKKQEILKPIPETFSMHLLISLEIIKEKKTRLYPTSLLDTMHWMFVPQVSGNNGNSIKQKIIINYKIIINSTCQNIRVSCFHVYPALDATYMTKYKRGHACRGSKNRHFENFKINISLSVGENFNCIFIEIIITYIAF